jgi:hypothetical protein
MCRAKEVDDMRMGSRSRGLVILVLGLWLFASPWILGSDLTAVVSWSGWALGALIVGTRLWALVGPVSPAPGFTAAMLGLAAFVSPWMLHFMNSLAQTISFGVVGIGVLVLASLELKEISGSVAANPPSGSR